MHEIECMQRIIEILKGMEIEHSRKLKLSPDYNSAWSVSVKARFTVSQVADSEIPGARPGAIRKAHRFR